MPGKERRATPGLARPLLVKAFAMMLAGILFSVNCYLTEAYPRVFLPFIGQSALAFAWAAPAGILMGLGYSLLGRSIRGDGPKAGTGARLPLVLLSGFLLTIFMLFVAPAETVQFYLLLFFLFPCAIMVFGAMNGRTWAVVLGSLLQLLIGLGTSLDGQDIPGLLSYALVFVAALELSYSSATTTRAIEKEVAEMAGAADERGRRNLMAAFDLAAGNCLLRLATCLGAAALAVALALAVYGSPGLFGPAYAESLEANTLEGLFLPGVAVLAALALGLLVPSDLLAKTKALAARARLAFRMLAFPVRPLPEEEELETF